MNRLVTLFVLLFATSAFAGDRIIYNPDVNGDVKIKVNKAGTPTDVITVTGSTGKATITQTFQMVWARVECDSTPGITFQGPVNWVSSFSFISTGTCDLEVSPGFFSSVDTVSCVCSDGDLSGNRHYCRLHPLASGDHTFRFDGYTPSTVADTTGHVICMGYTP